MEGHFIPFLRDGAIPVFDYLDIVHEYMYHYFSRIDPDAFSNRNRRSFSKKPPVQKPASKSGKPVQPAQKQEEPVTQPPEVPKSLTEEQISGLTGLQTQLARLIEKSPSTADEIIEASGISYADAAEALTELEIAGLIQLQPDGKYKLT